MKKLIIFAIILYVVISVAVIAISSCGGGRNMDETEELEPTEIREYEGERAKTEAEKALIEKGTALYQQEIAHTISKREQWRLSTAQLEYEISRAENRIIKRLQNNLIKLTDLSIPEGRSRNDNDIELDN